MACLIFVTALALRVTSPAPRPPYDDLYHAKRIAHFVEFDPDRGEHGAWCPWPPLYDLVMVDSPWTAAAGFALIAVLAMFTEGGWILALTLALSPALIDVSRLNHLDHHWLEPALLLAIVVSLMRRSAIGLAVALTLAMFVQTAFLVAAALAFVAVWLDRDFRKAALPFAIGAAAIVLYRLTRPAGYPDSPWFLGSPHAAAFGAAAIALTERSWRSLALGVAAALATPHAAESFLSGTSFFGGDPWLRSITEFQPMFRDRGAIGTDLANLTGGALLGVAALFRWTWSVVSGRWSVPPNARSAEQPTTDYRPPTTMVRKPSPEALFATIYLLLSLSSRRFLVPGVAVFALAGALAAARARSWRWAVAAAAITVLPPLVYDVATWRAPNPRHDDVYALANEVRTLPPGRVLAPWPYGHAIDVIGRHPVVIDNFGSMPDRIVFENANAALDHPQTLRRYCTSRGVRYVALPGGATIEGFVRVRPHVWMLR